jgi:hypothetical protein
METIRHFLDREPSTRAKRDFEQLLDQRGERLTEERPDFKFLGPDPSVKKEEEF